MLQTTSLVMCRHCSAQVVTPYRGYTDAIIQNMYFMFDIFIDIPTCVTSSVVVFDDVASPMLFTFNSVTICRAPRQFAYENMQLSSVI